MLQAVIVSLTIWALLLQSTCVIGKQILYTFDKTWTIYLLKVKQENATSIHFENCKSVG